MLNDTSIYQYELNSAPALQTDGRVLCFEAEASGIILLCTPVNFL